MIATNLRIGLNVLVTGRETGQIIGFLEETMDNRVFGFVLVQFPDGRKRYFRASELEAAA